MFKKAKGMEFLQSPRWQCRTQKNGGNWLHTVSQLIMRLDSLSKSILQGTLEGGQCCGRQMKWWMDSVKEWMSLSVPKLLTMASHYPKLEEDFCWILPYAPLMTESVLGLKDTVCKIQGGEVGIARAESHCLALLCIWNYWLFYPPPLSQIPVCHGDGQLLHFPSRHFFFLVKAMNPYLR